MKRVLTIVAVLAASIQLTSCLAGKYMCDYALKPSYHGQDFEADKARVDEWYPGISKWYDDLCAEGVFRDTTIVGEGGCKVWATFATAKDPANAQGTAVVIHGYTGNHIVFLNLIRMYRDELNYNVVAPNLHHHGHSEGEAVQMGWLDRFDVERFMAIAHEKWGDDFMVVHGVSMGGATTMMISGDDLPPYVRAFVDDCGYSSVWDQFSHNLRQMFHLPPFPVLNSASIVCRRRYGWGFKEASSVAQLAKCERPMLFIHGDNDDFVPTAHVYKNFEAKTKGYKELWLAPGSAHATAYKDHPEEYTRRVREFLLRAREL